MVRVACLPNKGTRISVELILELLSNGWTEQMILESYPTLTNADLMAVFAYLKECLETELFFHLKKLTIDKITVDRQYY
jgi:hypothetical protein